MLEDPLHQILKNCTVLFPEAKGQGRATGFFIADRLVVATAHGFANARRRARISGSYLGDRFDGVIIATLSDIDLVLIRVEIPSHPSVLLGTDCRIGDSLLAWGYPRNYIGDTIRGVVEGDSDTEQASSLLKISGTQILEGFSGAPVLNQRTGAVCGIIRTSRDTRQALGGRAIFTRSLLDAAPSIPKRNQQVHARDPIWHSVLTSDQREQLSGSTTPPAAILGREPELKPLRRFKLLLNSCNTRLLQLPAEFSGQVPAELLYLLALHSRFTDGHPPVIDHTHVPAFEAASRRLKENVTGVGPHLEELPDHSQAILVKLESTETARIIFTDPDADTAPSAIELPADIAVFAVLIHMAESMGDLRELDRAFTFLPESSWKRLRHLQRHFSTGVDLEEEAAAAGPSPPLMIPKLSLTSDADSPSAGNGFSTRTFTLFFSASQRTDALADAAAALDGTETPAHSAELALLYALSGDVPTALSLLSAVSSVSPSPVVLEYVTLAKAWVSVHLALSGTEDRDKANATVNELTDTAGSPSVETMVNAVLMYCELSEYSTAETLAVSLYNQFPTDLSIHLLARLTQSYGLLARDAGNAVESEIDQVLGGLEHIAVTSRSAGLTEEYNTSRYIRGLLLLRKAQQARTSARMASLNGAASELLEVLRRVPQVAGLRHLCVRTLIRSSRPHEAIEVLVALPEESRSELDHTYLVTAALAAGDVELAVDQFKRINWSEPVPVSVIANLGLLFLAMGNPDAALRGLSAAADRIGTSAWKLYFLRGRALYELQKYSEASAEFRRAIDSNSHNPRLLYYYCQSWRAGTGTQLRTLLESLRPECAKIGLNRALVEDVMKDLQTAVTEFSRDIDRSWGIAPSPDNDVPQLFAGHLDSLDDLSIKCDRLDEILSAMSRLTPSALAAHIREILGGAVSVSQVTEELDGEKLQSVKDWVSFHNSVNVESLIGSASVEIDIRSAETLACLGNAVNTDSVAHRLHLHALQLDSGADARVLQVYNHIDGIMRKAYQRAAVERIVFRCYGRALLADEVGLGKTIEAILSLTEYRLRGLVNRCLILTPSRGLALQWVDELKSKFGYSRSARDECNVCMHGERDWKFRDTFSTVVCTHHAAVANAEALSSETWDMVIVDESHHFRNRDSKRFKLLREFNSKYLLLLTATPIQNSLEDLHALCSVLRPALFGSLSEFRAAHCVNGSRFELRDAGKLATQLAEVMIRNTNRGVAGETAMVRRVFHDVTVELTSEERRLYDAIDQIVISSKGRDTLPLSYYALTKAACSSPAAVYRALAGLLQNAAGQAEMRLLRDTVELAACTQPVAKLQAVRKIAKQVHGETIVLFTEFRETARRLAEDLDAVYLEAGMPDGKQRSLLDAFLNGELSQILIATPRFSEGVNLQRSRNLINFDLPWNPFRLEQRVGRIHRVGQTASEINIFSISALKTIEHVIREVLVRKLKMFETAIGHVNIPWTAFSDKENIDEQIRTVLGGATDHASASSRLEEFLEDELNPFLESDENGESRDAVNQAMQSIEVALNEIEDSR